MDLSVNAKETKNLSLILASFTVVNNFSKGECNNLFNKARRREAVSGGRGAFSIHLIKSVVVELYNKNIEHPETVFWYEIQKDAHMITS